MDQERSDESLVNGYRSGREKDFEILIERYKPVVRIMSRARFLIGGDEEDLIQEGMIGLFQAVRSFEEGRDASFKTFAGLCINRQMIKAIRSSMREKNRVLNDSLRLTDEALLTVSAGDKLSPESIIIDREVTDELFDKIRGVLSPMEKRVFDLYMGGMDYLSIASAMERSPKSVDNALQRIRRKAGEIVTKT